MKIYDLLTIDYEKDTFRGFATASLKSSSSTALKVGECPVDTCIVQVLYIITYIMFKSQIEVHYILILKIRKF